ncbi:MAG: aspartate aminotransferase family protein [Gemmatimonadota bacterium]|nr:aspartate aminotransferase family protein [Gemmatimonadota bacterium]
MPTNTDDIALPGRTAPLAMDADTFRALGHEMVDQVAELLATLPDRPVTRGETPSEVRAALNAERDLPETGEDAGAVLGRATTLLKEHSLYNGHPRFFGYITSPPAPIGILGDLLAAAINPNVGAWVLSPMAAEMELQSIRWLSQLVGFPDDGGGILVSGGNVANMLGFWTARVAKGGLEVRAAGMAGIGGGRLRAYGSAETHTWIQKAADLAGLGTESVRWIPTDEDLRMDVGKLRAAIEADLAAGDRPFMVVGTAGSVSTGAVDPLPEIAKLCREFDLWFHVDGAYGAFAAALPDAPSDLKALAGADSVAMDPHKWLYAPLEAGAVLVRDADRLRDAFSYHPAYYHFGQSAINFFDRGIQNSRGFRALKVWLQLQHAGREGYVRMIGDDCRLSRELHRHVADTHELEPHHQSLSISTFRFVPDDLEERAGEEAVGEYLNALNRAIQARLEREGEAFVSNAVVRGRYLLRACIVNFHTDTDDVEALPEIVVRTGRKVDAEMRTEGLGEG